MPTKPEFIFICCRKKIMYIKEDNAKGYKVRKDRVTVMLATNMTGTYKLEPLVIGKYSKPRCFKTIKLLPCQYASNSSCWVTRKIFQDLLIKWNKLFQRDNKKICLLVDSCSSYLLVGELSHIKILYLPKNTTSILQPLDQGIIALLKVNYRKLYQRK